MASTMLPKYSDQVRVSLTAASQPSTASYHDRHLLLSRRASSLVIGRASKRNSTLHASRSNAWIESAVVSRNHAVLLFDAEQKKVLIKDTDSLHGTFLNGTRLAKNEPRQLQQGDELKFGITVERNGQSFPPCVMKVDLDYGCAGRPEGTPAVFRVPDDTDIEEIESDDDDLSICNSTGVLRENGFRPAQPVDMSNVVAIDLTSEAETTAEKQTLSPPLITTASKPQSEPPEHDGSLESLQNDHVAGEEDGHVAGGEQCESGGQPTSADDSFRGADSPVEPRRTSKRPDLVPGTESDEWEDCSSSVFSPAESARPLPHGCSLTVAAPQSPESPSRDRLATLPASWETDELSAVDDEAVGSEDDAFCLNPVLSSLPPTSPSPICGRIHMEQQVAAAEQEMPPAQDLGYYCDPAKTMISHPEPGLMPPETSPGGLPSLDSTRRLVSGRVRLPPLARAVFPRLCQDQDPLSAAETLGAKTGKMEYFTARAQNKRVAESRYGESFHGGEPVADCLARPMSKTDGEDSLMGDAINDGQRGHGQCARGLDPPFVIPGEGTLNLEGASTASLLASGEKFLSSPLREPEAPVRAPSCLELDETSTYQFLLSKRDVAMGKARPRRTCVAIDDLIEAYPRRLADSGKPGQKRKAEEISGSTAEEKAAEGKDAGEPSSTSTGSVPLDSKARTAAVAEAGCSRTAKRLRTAAEIFGYAALGGVAVVSALIATAPAL